jgi:hypothetical protein
MSISNFFKKTVLTGALITGTLFAAQNAYSQDRFNEDDKPAVEQKQEKKVNLTDDDKTISNKLDNMFRGSLQVRAETEPLVDRISGNAYLEYKTGNLRPFVGIQDVFEKYDNIDGSKLDVNSIREIAGLGIYLANSKEFESFLRLAIGNENSKFSNAIDMDARRFIYGGEFGIASVEHGYKFLGKFYKGTGKFDADLKSGFEINGDFDTTYAGVEGRIALKRDGKKTATSSEFDKRQDERDANFTIDALVDFSWNKNKYGSLEQDDTTQFKFGPSFTWNSRNENGEGKIWSITPYGVVKNINTESGISLRETQTKTAGAGLIVTYSPNSHWSLSSTLGYEHNSQKIEDPGQNFNKTETKNGGVFGVVIKYDF